MNATTMEEEDAQPVRQNVIADIRLLNVTNLQAYALVHVFRLQDIAVTTTPIAQAGKSVYRKLAGVPHKVT